MPLFCALASALCTLWLGLADYETTSVGQLASAENAPFMMAAFLVLFAVFFGVASLGRWTLQRLTLHRLG